MSKGRLAQKLAETQEYCRNGHVRSDENTIWEKGSNDKMRRRCRICRKISQAARQEQRTGIDALNVLPITNYADLQGEDKVAHQQFHSALDMVTANCRGRPDLWSDYEEDQIPSPEYASELCAFCPLQALCRKEAIAVKPGWGVQGGVVYAYGHEYYQGTYDPREGTNDDSYNE